MNTTSKSLLNRADSLANEYNTAVSGANRDKIKAEWYKEVKRIAAFIETHSTFSEKKDKKFFKNKKVLINRLKDKK